MSDFRNLDDLDVAGKTVLVRGDLNVPSKDGKVTDATRIERFAPTVTELLSKGARVVIMSHFGRPKGGFDAEFSLKFLLPALEKAVGSKVAFASDCIGPEAEKVVKSLKNGEAALLENLRFHAGEEKNDPTFVKALAALGDLYVNDAFSAAHRAHASTEGLAHVLPSAAGRLMQVEVEALSKALEKPERPVAAVVGGAKISTKLELLFNLVQKVDYLVLGGGMANTFLYAKGIDVGSSLCEKEMAEQARAITVKAAESSCEIILPVDAVVAAKFAAGAENSTVPADAIPADRMMLDIGAASVANVIAKLDAVKTVVWNGPLGAFEIKPFDAATNAVAQAVAKLTKAGKVLSVAGGGDTVSALHNAGVSEDFSYVSSAGGAFLEWLEGKELPGVAALRRS
jgi:phosphoglycerate kinase